LSALRTYIVNNRPLIPNYGERYRNGEPIATGFVESTVHEVVSKRFCKKQQMQWSKAGAHLGTSQMPIDSFNTNLWWWYDSDQSIESLRLITATHQPEATRCSLSDAQI